MKHCNDLITDTVFVIYVYIFGVYFKLQSVNKRDNYNMVCLYVVRVKSTQ
jgi:hypothetical protein